MNMARVQSPLVPTQNIVPRNYAEQSAELRVLKDEIVGHVQHKEQWVQKGILETVVNTLQNSTPSRSRSNGKETANYATTSGGLSDDELVRLLCLQILASISCGGPSFLSPLHAVGVVPVTLSYISPNENPPQVVLTALRIIRNIAEATSAAPPGSDDLDVLADALFKREHVGSLYSILVQASADLMVQEQKRLVSALIARLCKEDTHQNPLTDGGILDALATILASFIVARGEVIPEAEKLAQKDGLADMIPAPALRGASLALTLEAISAIILNSRFRCCMFLYSPAILALLPLIEFTPVSKEPRASWSPDVPGIGGASRKSFGAMDYLLPLIPTSHLKSSSSQLTQFPSTGLSRNVFSSRRSQTYKFTGLDPTSEDSDVADHPESPVVPWLIYVVRSTSGFERVAAASVLTSLFKAGLTSPEREQALACLVVPLLCDLIKEHQKDVPASVQQATFIESDMERDWAILEKTPEVLARLVGASECLQISAHECGIIKTTAKLLKDAYEPMTSPLIPKPWTPNPDRNMSSAESSAACRLGPPGQVPLYAHKIKMRYSALTLVAGMGMLRDDYRKEAASQDLVPFIVESLAARPGKPQSPKEKAASAKEGRDRAGVSAYGHNPNRVIIAACNALRCLGRAVSVLRTTFLDHDVWQPVNKLMKHPNSVVQIQACTVVINLLATSSPMVEPLLGAGISKVLCEQAHSLNPGLRLNSMWALKHLVLGFENSQKKQLLEELEPGWLVQLISDDSSEEDTLHTRQRRSTDADDDEDMDAEASDEEESHSWVWSGMNNNPRRMNSTRMQKAEARLTALREADLNPARKARADATSIQEQALGFIQNFIVNPDKPSDQTELVDFLFSELGENRLFGILADKLKVRVVGAYGRRYSKTRDTVVLYPQAKIIMHITYILVHIAASIPRHRQLVIAQTELLKLLGGHFTSSSVEVRRALCHLFANLSCLEDDDDRQHCKQRALELEKLGVLSKLEGLERDDTDLDVRERAKAVVAQFKAPTIV
ncbi:armadillo-type protein [Triangularia verruculosa]|uniref:Armadillo-type protein n=1 Tax=Triangularia verruculosa TaxID=2587418 RepID=A0AAN6XBD4_9PEZI|nr:armadillo-type protein [Triangularia verruculosa]